MTGVQTCALPIWETIPAPDPEVPRSGDLPKDIEDIDSPDDEVPLAKMNVSQPGGTVMGYLPVYIGIGAVAASALAVTAIYLTKRRKALAAKPSDKPANPPSGDEK